MSRNLIFGLFEVSRPSGGNYSITKNGTVIPTSGKAQKQDESKFKDSLGGNSANYTNKNHK
jgi:hypothetical protein